jgi:hypothetical protein
MMNIHSQITDTEHELPENGWEGLSATEIALAASPRPRPTISIFGKAPGFSLTLVYGIFTLIYYESTFSFHQGRPDP